MKNQQLCKKTALIEAQHCNKKVLVMIMLIGILLFLPQISGWEWDNIKYYDDETKTITIKNSILRILPLDTLAEVTLDTPLTFSVMHGKDRKVAQYTITNNYDGYENVFKRIDLYDIDNNNQRLDRTITYKYLTYEEVEKPSRYKECGVYDKGDKIGEPYCDMIENGTQIVQEERWIVLDKNIPLSKGNITIGLFTEVKKGDYVEWIPTLFGVRIDEWAAWTASFDTNLVYYGGFNETAGVIYNHANNGRNNGSTDATSVVGGICLFDNCFNYTDIGGEGTLFDDDDDAFDFAGGDFTINYWARLESVTENIIDRSGLSGASTSGWVFDLDNKAYVTNALDNAWGISNFDMGALNQNQWSMRTIRRDGTNLSFWRDGDCYSSTTLNWVIPDKATQVGFGEVQNTAGGTDGVLDELAVWKGRAVSDADIVLLWNGGLGISPNSVYSVEFDYPANISYNHLVDELNYTYAELEYCWYSTDGGNTNSSTQSCGDNFTSITTAQGSQTWTLYGNTSGNLVTNVTRTFFVDTIAPKVNVTNPRGLEDYGRIGTTLRVNWSVYDASLGDCWFEYPKGTNVTVNCTLGGNTTLLNLTDMQTNFTFYVNDTSNNIGSNYTNWTYKVWEYSQNFSNTTYAGETELFSINLTTAGVTLWSAKIDYNGTNYTGTILNTGDTRYKVSKQVGIPGVEAKVNMTFRWILSMSDGTDVYVSKKNQTINPLNITNCSTGGFVLFNFTLRDEESQTFLTGADLNITGEVEINISTLSGAQILHFHEAYNNTNPMRVCAGEDLGNAIYRVDGVIRHTSAGRVDEFYNIQNMSYSNDSITQNIDLYGLLSADSTPFLVTYKDDSFLSVSNALIIIQRKYISEGVFKTVEIPRTDDSGQAIGHFDLEGAIYTIIISKEGTILSTFDNIAVVCQDVIIGDCDINLNAASSHIGFDDWDQLGDLNINTNFDYGTQTASYIVSSASGGVKTIQLNITKFDRFGNQTVCFDRIVTTSGTLSCAVPSSYGNSTVIAKVYSDGELIKIDTYNLADNPRDNFGFDGAFMVLILMITIPLMLTSSRVGLVLGVLVGFGMASMLMLMKTGSILGVGSAVIWLFIAGGIIIWKISSRD